MAKSRTPQKRHRQSLRRHERNRARLSATRTAVRQARESLAAGARDEAEAAVQQAASILDRTARRRTIHPNKAARTKSRLMRKLNALGGTGTEAGGGGRARAAGRKTSRSSRSKQD